MSLWLLLESGNQANWAEPGAGSGGAVPSASVPTRPVGDGGQVAALFQGPHEPGIV